MNTTETRLKDIIAWVAKEHEANVDNIAEITITFSTTGIISSHTLKYTFEKEIPYVTNEYG